jgi:hypothetical protein
MISDQERHLIEHFIVLLIIISKHFHYLYLEEVQQERGFAIYENHTPQFHKISHAHHVQASIVFRYIESVNHQFIKNNMNVDRIKYFPKTNPKECVNVLNVNYDCRLTTINFAGHR